MNKYIVITLMVCSIVFSEDKTYTFTAEEVQSFRSSIIELEKKDSLNVDIIKGLESQIFNYGLQIQNDSLIISQLELKNKLQTDFVGDLQSILTHIRYQNKVIMYNHL